MRIVINKMKMNRMINNLFLKFKKFIRNLIITVLLVIIIMIKMKKLMIKIEMKIIKMT